MTGPETGGGMTGMVEIETKYELAVDAGVPELLGVAGVSRVLTRPVEVLTAAYWDTEDLALLGFGATLRRREGGADQGWHLKLRLSRAERLELQCPLGDDAAPPDQFLDLLAPIARSRPVIRVATLVTERQVHQLLDRSERVLVEMADDGVAASLVGEEEPSLRWRELELELVEGDQAVLTELDAAVRAAGIQPAKGSSKVSRLLQPLATPPVVTIPRSVSVSRYLASVLGRFADDVVRTQLLVQLDRPGAVVELRDAARRALAAAVTARKLTDVDLARAAERHLATLIASAETVLAIEHVGSQVAQQLGKQPPALFTGPAQERWRIEMEARRSAARDELAGVLGSSDHSELPRALTGIAAELGQRDQRRPRARAALAKAAIKAQRRLNARLGPLVRSDGTDISEDEVRTARRAADVAVLRRELAQELGVSTSAADDLVNRVQADLWLVHLAVVTECLARHVGRVAEEVGESAFAFGRLHGANDADVSLLLRRLRRSRRKLRAVL